MQIINHLWQTVELFCFSDLNILTDDRDVTSDTDELFCTVQNLSSGICANNHALISSSWMTSPRLLRTTTWTHVRAASNSRTHPQCGYTFFLIWLFLDLLLIIISSDGELRNHSEAALNEYKIFPLKMVCRAYVTDGRLSRHASGLYSCNCGHF